MLQKIEQYFRNKEISKTGVYLGEIHENSPRMRAFICFLRGFIIFLGTYGTLVGLLKAFDLPFNTLILALAFLFISMYVAFLYFHKIFFYTGYFLLLGGFTYELVHMYLYANSGYQAIVNEIYLAYSDYYKLLSIREAQEFISQREITITVAMLFIGTFLAMMLNVTISGYMNLVETMLVSFPILEVAFLIEKKPPLYCLIMVLTMYIFVGILQASRHQRMLVKDKHTHEYARYTRKKNKYYFYQANARGNLLALIFSLVISVAIGIFSFPNYQSNTTIVRHNPIRKQIDEYVKIYVQSGWTGWMNRYDNTGGMNTGRLGGVGSVRPDFETDLSVTFAPYTYDTVYLKGFTGSFYSQNQWFAHTYMGNIASLRDVVDEAYENQDSDMPRNIKTMLEDDEIKRLEVKDFASPRATARMNIVNLDADPSFSYLPYHTDYTKYSPFLKSKTDSLELENGVDITYSPYMDYYYDIPENYEGIESPEYEYYVDQSCVTVPDTLVPVLQSYIIDHNYFGANVNGFTEEENLSLYEDVNDYRISMARAIYAHYMSEFKYTMSPGATPISKDYVDYFLNTQKRGFCAHFASSGAMLLRAMDVPARYVEGYCIPSSLLIENGRAVTEDFSEWYEGDSLITEQVVVNVPVNDSYAHAWIEIYMEGYGWVPFEMTIPSDEEEQTSGGFGDLFAGLFNIRMDIAELPSSENTNTASELNSRLSNLFSINVDYQKFIVPILIASAIIFIGLLAFVSIRRIREERRLKALYEQNAFPELVYIKYSAFTDYLLSRPEIRTNEDNPLPSDVLEQLKRLLKNRTPEITDESLKKLFVYIERTLYSKVPGTREEYDAFLEQITLIKKTLKGLK